MTQRCDVYRLPDSPELPAPRMFCVHGTGDVRLVGDERGGPSGPSVLLLHATGRSRDMWTDLARLLANDGLHVLNLDLRGHGDSDWSVAGDYSIDAFAADVQAVCQQHGPFDVIFGTSLGAVAAVLAAARASSPLSAGLVLVDVEPTIESPDMHRIRVGPDGQRWKSDPRALDICQRPLGRARNELIRQALGAVSAPVLFVRGALPRPASVAGTHRLASAAADGEVVDLASRLSPRREPEPQQALSSLVAAFVRRRTRELKGA